MVPARADNDLAVRRKSWTTEGGEEMVPVLPAADGLSVPAPPAKHRETSGLDLQSVRASPPPSMEKMNHGLGQKARGFSANF
jgi:hypothetical protein